MIPVTVLDVVVPDPEKDHRILVLTDESMRRLLALWIGPFEADSISLHLREKKISRPMTYHFMSGLLDKAGVQIESVAVSALENDCFYATVYVRNGEKAFAVDARPSDAIAMALYTHSPISVAIEVMDAVAEEIPDGMEITAQGKGSLSYMKIDPDEEERRLKEREKWESMSPEERREENREKLLANLTGSGCLSQSAEPADE